ncbi:MAG TPA: hypothetical protein VHY37_03675 [Tepidisphaeraceae bacterium]|jgi:hypothetical protein|nr:hypothetical protein [Tepidisphaeraceae bacterium]
MNANALPEHIITRFRDDQKREAEQRFAVDHLVIAGHAAAKMPKAVADTIIGTALADVSGGRFYYGRPGFVVAALASSNLPFLLWLALRPAHPAITEVGVVELLEKHTADTSAITDAVYDAMGFVPKQSAEDANNNRLGQAAR